MFKLKNLKRIFLPSPSEKRSSTSNENQSSISSSSLSTNEVTFNEKQVQLLTQWLDRLNKEKLIILTDQDDIVIQAGGKADPNQQIFVNENDIHTYMQKKKAQQRKTTDDSDTISMSDLARILLTFSYVYESSGQLSFPAHTIALDNNQLKWLKSIIHHVQPNSKSSQTDVKLSDGENTQILSISYEYLAPTNDKEIVARYLFKNGHIRYDVDNRTYAYRYIEPDPLLDDQQNSSERISQRQYLSFHIRDIHVDQKTKRIRIQFQHQTNEDLILPSQWYDQISHHRFDRDYILDVLLANGGVVHRNRFVFMGRSFVLEGSQQRNNSTSPSMKTIHLSWKEKTDLIHRFINLVMTMDAVKQDQSNGLLVLQNETDGEQLYFTSEHSTFIEKNRFRREDVIHILLKYSQIKQDQYNRWFLIYNNQSIQFPPSILPTETNHHRTSSLDRQYRPRMEQLFPPTGSSSSNIEKDFIKRYDELIDYMCRHGLVTWDKSSNLIRLHFADQNLLLPISHLRSMIDPRLFASTDANLPFTSRQLSQWLRNNSYITRRHNSMK